MLCVVFASCWLSVNVFLPVNYRQFGNVVKADICVCVIVTEYYVTTAESRCSY